MPRDRLLSNLTAHHSPCKLVSAFRTMASTMLASRRLTLVLLVAVAAPIGLVKGLSAQTSTTPNAAAASAGEPVILSRDQSGALMPSTVFFKGQTAPIQARNSSGLRLPGNRLVLLALVDSSGYASDMQETYQAYLLTEVPLRFGDQTLQPGAYGVGFVKDTGFTCLDLGGQAVLTTASQRDASLPRPVPLQILPGASGKFRLYAGRNYVEFLPASRTTQ